MATEAVDLDALLLDAQNQQPARAERGGKLAPLSSSPLQSGAARGIGKVHYTHDAMIDLIIANPAVSQNALAAHFGYTASWVSQVIASDAFQNRLMERKEEIVDPTIRASVKEQFEGLIQRSLAILREKLDRPSHQIPDNLALRSLELTARAAGYGARDVPVPPPAPGHVENHLYVLSENLVGLLQRRRAEVAIPEGIVSDQTTT